MKNLLRTVLIVNLFIIVASAEALLRYGLDLLPVAGLLVGFGFLFGYLVQTHLNGPQPLMMGGILSGCAGVVLAIDTPVYALLLFVTVCWSWIVLGVYRQESDREPEADEPFSLVFGNFGREPGQKGWRVHQSEGVSRKVCQYIINDLCTVPRNETRVYRTIRKFGRILTVEGEETGVDGYGRPGAWKFQVTAIPCPGTGARLARWRYR